MSSNTVSKIYIHLHLFFFCVVSFKTCHNFLLFSHRLNIAIVKAFVVRIQRGLSIEDERNVLCGSDCLCGTRSKPCKNGKFVLQHVLRFQCYRRLYSNKQTRFITYFLISCRKVREARKSGNVLLLDRKNLVFALHITQLKQKKHRDKKTQRRQGI